MTPGTWMTVAAGFVCLVVSGCETAQISKSGSWQTSEPITPTSYQVSRERLSRSVGKLRRMAVLQVEQPAPKACGASGDPAPQFHAVDDELRDEVLARRKGYEVIVPDPQRDAEWLMPPGSAAFLQEVMRWPPGVEDFPAGPATKALLEHLHRVDQVDGLLILRVQDTCGNADPGVRTLVGVFSAGLSEILPNRQMTEVHKFYRAAVFETSSAHVVWQVGLPADDVNLNYYLGPQNQKTTPKKMEQVFESLEPATPKVLTR